MSMLLGTRRTLLQSVDRGDMLPQYLLNSYGAEIEGFDSVAEWVVSLGSAADNITEGEFRTGASSIKLTTGVGANAIMTKTLDAPLTLNSGEHLRLYFYMHDFDNAARIRFYLFTAGYATALEHTIEFAPLIPPCRNGWNVIDLYEDGFGGTASWSDTFPLLRIRLEPKPGVQCSISCDSLRAGLQSVPAVLWMFDDEQSSIYDLAYLYMQPRNANATFYIKTAAVNTGANITDAQLLTMEGGGWSIANHTRSHVYDLPYAAFLADIQNGRADLAGWGLSVAIDHFAYPGGQYDDDRILAAVNAPCLTARVTGKGFVGLDVYGDQLFVLPIYMGVNTLTLAQLQGFVDEAILYNRPIVLFAHTIGPGADITQADFEAIIDYTQAVGIPHLTINDIYDSLSGPITKPPG